MRSTATGMSSDVPSSLMELLYLRAVWALPALGGVPQLTSPPQHATRQPAPAIASEWPVAWQEALNQLRDGALDVRIPLWRRTYGLEGIDEAHLRAWRDNNRRAHTDSYLHQATDRRSRKRRRATFGTAVRCGLRMQYVLIGVDPFHTWLSPNMLLIAQSTRFSPDAYDRVLAHHLPSG